MSNKTVLITGGSGSIGKVLSAFLEKRGHKVSVLSRNIPRNAEYKYYKWDIKGHYIDPQALLNNKIIIHLAGANIGENRWTSSFKKEVLKSRTDSVRLIADGFRRLNILPERFISASAVGYYGSITSEKIFTEKDPPADDFLGKVGKAWEGAVNDLANSGVPTAILRTGVVLDTNSGALPKTAKPVKLGLGAPLGSGKQYVPWIHIADLCRMYYYIIENELEGVYNAVSPNPVKNNEFMKSIARSLKKPMFMPKVPSFVLKAMLGEQSTIILDGSRVSAEKICNAGFSFQFPEIDEAVSDLLA